MSEDLDVGWWVVGGVAGWEGDSDGGAVEGGVVLVLPERSP